MVEDSSQRMVCLDLEEEEGTLQRKMKEVVGMDKGSLEVCHLREQVLEIQRVVLVGK